MLHWLVVVNLGINQLLNAATGGSIHMTISARAGYARAHGSHFGKSLCAVLQHTVPTHARGLPGDHCDVAVLHYEQRQHP